jgi:hypothetical protein
MDEKSVDSCYILLREKRGEKYIGHTCFPELESSIRVHNKIQKLMFLRKLRYF